MVSAPPSLTMRHRPAVAGPALQPRAEALGKVARARRRSGRTRSGRAGRRPGAGRFRPRPAASRRGWRGSARPHGRSWDNAPAPSSAVRRRSAWPRHCRRGARSRRHCAAALRRAPGGACAAGAPPPVGAAAAGPGRRRRRVLAACAAAPRGWAGRRHGSAGSPPFRRPSSRSGRRRPLPAPSAASATCRVSTRIGSASAICRPRARSSGPIRWDPRRPRA